MKMDAVTPGYEDEYGQAVTCISPQFESLEEKIERFLSYRYFIALRPLTEEEGGGWLATIPELGSAAFIATNETPAAVLWDLDMLRRHLIPSIVKSGCDLPEPEMRDPVILFGDRRIDP